MGHKHCSGQIFQIGVCGALLLLTAGSARAADPKPAAPKDKTPAACSAAYKSAIESEKAGRLRQAQEQLMTCAKATCGAFLKSECTTRFTQLDSDIPSVVPLVTSCSCA